MTIIPLHHAAPAEDEHRRRLPDRWCFNCGYAHLSQQSAGCGWSPRPETFRHYVAALANQATTPLLPAELAEWSRAHIELCRAVAAELTEWAEIAESLSASAGPRRG